MLQIKEIDFKKIVAVDIWILKNNDNNQAFKNHQKLFFLIRLFLRVIYRSFFSIPKITIDNPKHLDIFYIRTYSRPDLNKHSRIYEEIPGTTVCLIGERKKKIDLLNFFKVCVFLIVKSKSWVSVIKKNDFKFFSFFNFYIFLKYFETFSDVFKIFPILKLHKKLVCFQEMLPVENLLCQCANNVNIKTYALQHALSIYSYEGGYESRLPICYYINLVSKNILCWGEHSKKIYQKHSKANLHIVGKAYIPELESNENGVTFIFENKEFKDTNEKLLQLSEDFKTKSIPISRWFKPSNPLNKSGIIREGPLREIIIGCNSSFIVELAFLGFKVFVTENSNLSKLLPKELIITDKNFFEKKKLLQNYPSKIWKKFVKCTGKNSVAKYKSILDLDLI